jgi:hypothetical protein
MSLKRRIDAIEATERRRERQWLARMAAECGLTVDELLAEAEDFFSLPLVEQLAEVDRINEGLQAEGLSMDAIEDIKATLIRKYRP